MERCASIHNTNTNSSGSSMQFLNSVKINNYTMINKQNDVMDLKKLSSRIICSDNITRQNINKKPTASTTIFTTEDDDQFFNQIKSKIDKDILLRSKENYRPTVNFQSTNLARRKRPIIDPETHNVIKRFKKDANHMNSVQLNNTNIIQSNRVNNVTKETRNVSTNIINENIMQQKNMFSCNMLNKNFRIPSSKYVFQVTSKLQKNVLPLPVDETTIFHEEYEESLFYGTMFLTPPDSNSIEDNSDS